MRTNEALAALGLVAPLATFLLGWRIGFERGARWIWLEIQGQQVQAAMRAAGRLDPPEPDGTMAPGEK